MSGLNDGSGRSGRERRVGDFTVAGLATRVTDQPPTDADWGETPPPNGTTVIEDAHTLWVRLGNQWYGRVLDWDFIP